MSYSGSLKYKNNFLIWKYSLYKGPIDLTWQQLIYLTWQEVAPEQQQLGMYTKLLTLTNMGLMKLQESMMWSKPKKMVLDPVLKSGLF